MNEAPVVSSLDAAAAVGPREALTVDCPVDHCRATSGDFCRVIEGHPKQYPHGERYAAARDARPNSPAIWLEVRAERVRAHAKHGVTSMESAPSDDPTGRRLRILLEEVGEVAKEFNDAEHDQRPVDMAAVRKELIQVAAMAGAWADAITGVRR